MMNCYLKSILTMEVEWRCAEKIDFFCLDSIILRMENTGISVFITSGVTLLLAGSAVFALNYYSTYNVINRHIESGSYTTRDLMKQIDDAAANWRLNAEDAQTLRLRVCGM